MGDFKIINCYKEAISPCKFIGKRYKNKDRVNGSYSYHWGQWFENSWFAPIEELQTEPFKASFPEAEAYLGFMRYKHGADEDYFEYWIGLFVPVDAEVPEGYETADISHNYIGVCWIQGPEHQVYMREEQCLNTLEANGYEIAAEEDGGLYMFERYTHRFVNKDEEGRVILDLGFFVK